MQSSAVCFRWFERLNTAQRQWLQIFQTWYLILPQFSAKKILCRSYCKLALVMLSTSQRYSSSSVILNYCTYPVAWSTPPKTHCGTVFRAAALEKRGSLPTAVSSIETMCTGPPTGAKFFIRSSEQARVCDSSWISFVAVGHMRSFSTYESIYFLMNSVWNYFGESSNTQLFSFTWNISIVVLWERERVYWHKH